MTLSFTFYQNPNTKVVQDNQGQFRMYATDTIGVGELILCESVLCGSLPFLRLALARDPDLYNTLYPRTPKEPPSFPTEMNDRSAFIQQYLACVENPLLIEKINCNAFTSPHMDDNFVLGHVCTKINHSCKHNMTWYALPPIEEMKQVATKGVKPEDQRLFIIIANTVIKAGEECVHSYGPRVGHDDSVKIDKSFACSCGMNEEESKAYDTQKDNVLNTNTNKYVVKALKKVTKYIMKHIVKKDSPVHKVWQKQAEIRLELDMLGQYYSST